MRVTTDYISVGCNRGTSTSDVDADGLVAFGAGKLVALWNSRDSTHHGVYTTLPGHTHLVTKVRYLPLSPSTVGIASGDESGHVRVWKPSTSSSSLSEPSFTSHASVQAHTQSVSALGVLPSSAQGSGSQLLVTGGSDGFVKIWNVGEEMELLQTIDLGGKLPLELVVAQLPGSNSLVLAIALTHRIIQIYTQSSSVSPPSSSTSNPFGQFQQSIALEGHEDWVRCLSFTTYPRASAFVDTEDDLMLASGSQDAYIRLWRISRVNQNSPTGGPSTPLKSGDGDELNDEMLDEFERRMRGEGAAEEEGQGAQLSTKAHALVVDDGSGSNVQYSINLESVLIGHEGWVTNVRWSPSASSNPPLLLSTAADNSMIIWSPPSTSSPIWLARHRFGEMGGKGLGLFGALWAMGKDAMSVVASSWNGGFNRWRLDEGNMVDGEWVPEIAPTGHQNAVKDVAWDPAGEYLLSVSTDRTTRAHAPWRRSDMTTWAEIGRPQIHGYDMTCVAFLGRLRFVSGADEKVVRVFDAPRGFAESLRKLGVTNDDLASTATSIGASVPPLGLSNRALAKARAAEPLTGKLTTMNEEHISITESMEKVPTEAVLASSTLWPEIEKLYGHGYELMTCAVSPNRKLLATACKATSAEHAVVRLYDTTTWKQVGLPLEGHNLTITKIAFSHDNQSILTCSRDRTWRLFRASGEGQGFEPVAAEKPHARIIWDCAWAPSDRFFVTVARDKQMKLWQPSAEAESSKWACTAMVKMQEAPTAVDIVRDPRAQRDLLAVGFENGTIDIYGVDVDNAIACQLIQHIGSDLAHVDQIHRLAWHSGATGLQLASCSEDRSVRLFSISKE